MAEVILTYVGFKHFARTPKELASTLYYLIMLYLLGDLTVPEKEFPRFKNFICRFELEKSNPYRDDLDMVLRLFEANKDSGNTIFEDTLRFTEVTMESLTDADDIHMCKTYGENRANSRVWQKVIKDTADLFYDTGPKAYALLMSPNFKTRFEQDRIAPKSPKRNFTERQQLLERLRHHDERMDELQRRVDDHEKTISALIERLGDVDIYNSGDQGEQKSRLSEHGTDPYGETRTGRGQAA